MKYLILVSMLLTGCPENSSEIAPSSKSVFHMTEEDVGGWIGRIENQEVICYKYYSNGGLQCKWK